MIYILYFQTNTIYHIKLVSPMNIYNSICFISFSNPSCFITDGVTGSYVFLLQLTIKKLPHTKSETDDRRWTGYIKFTLINFLWPISIEPVFSIPAAEKFLSLFFRGSSYQSWSHITLKQILWKWRAEHKQKFWWPGTPSFHFIFVHLQIPYNLILNFVEKKKNSQNYTKQVWVHYCQAQVLLKLGLS